MVSKILIVLFLLELKHFLADYVLQHRSLSDINSRKRAEGFEGVLAVASHAFDHLLMFSLLFVFFGFIFYASFNIVFPVSLILIDFISHFLIDFVKVKIEHLKLLNKKILLIIDQSLHQFCYLYILVAILNS